VKTEMWKPLETGTSEPVNAHCGRRRDGSDAIDIDIEAGPNVVLHGLTIDQLHRQRLDITITLISG